MWAAACAGGGGSDAEGSRVQLTRIAALARLPLHDASVHVARALGLCLRGLLECVAHVRRADVRVLKVGDADVPPGRHGQPACEAVGRNSKRRWSPKHKIGGATAQRTPWCSGTEHWRSGVERGVPGPTSPSPPAPFSPSPVFGPPNVAMWWASAPHALQRGRK